MATNMAAIAARGATVATEQPRWGWLYRIGGAAALLSVVFFPIQIAVFFISPPPDSVPGWFQLLQTHRMFALLDLDLLLVVDQYLAILMLLALYVALRRASESVMLVGVGLALASGVLFVASNPAFAMLSLSDGYAAAATEAQKAAYLAAGQATLAQWQGSAFQASYLVGSIADIFIAAVMLRNGLFSKATGILGITANVLALGLYVPGIGTYISIFSIVFLWAWYILIGVRLLWLAGTPAAE